MASVVMTAPMGAYPALSAFATDEFDEDIDPEPAEDAEPDEDFDYTDLDDLIAEIPAARAESDAEDAEVTAEEFDAEPDEEEPAPRDRR